MNFQGTQTLNQPLQRVWDALLDPTVLQQCVAGCDKFERTSDTEYVSSVKVSIGPVSARFASTMTLLEMTPPSACTLRFAGQGGVAGFGKGEAKVALTAVSARLDGRRPGGRQDRTAGCAPDRRHGAQDERGLFSAFCRPARDGAARGRA